MRKLAIIVLLLLLPLAYSDNTCIACATFANASQAHILPVLDESGKTLTLNAYYENLTASPSRVPINSTIIIIEVTNSTSLRQIYKVYTDQQGQAVFNFASTMPNGYDGCINMKSLYCPFCDPSAPLCGFNECLQYSKINTSPGYYTNALNVGGVQSASDIPDQGASVSPLNPNRYFPDVEMTTYCAPPRPLSATPALCLPLLIIFSLLSGALYMTGRNPFAGFNIGGQRVGRHIRYQARGRGFSFSVMSAISAVTTVTDSVKAARKGELGKREAAAAKNRVFGAGALMASSAGRTKLFSAMSVAGRAAKGKGFTKGIQAYGRVVESGMAQSSGASRGPSATATAGGGMVMTPGGGGSTLRASDLSSNRSGFFGYFLNVGQALGTVALFMLGNSNVGRCLTSMGSWFMWSGFISNPNNLKMSEDVSLTGGLVRSEARARTDIQAINDILGSGTGIPVDLGGGQQGMARNVQIMRDKDNNVTGAVLVLDPMPGSGVNGPVTVRMNSQGTITEMSFTVPKVDAQGRPVLDPSGQPAQVQLIGRQDAQGNVQYFTRESGGREVAVDSTQRVDVVLGSGATQRTIHESIGTVMIEAMPGSSIHVGGNGSAMMDQAASTQMTLSEINSSLRTEVANVRAQIDQRLSDEATRNPDVQRLVNNQRYDVATNELHLALGISESDLRTGGHGELFAGLAKPGEPGQGGHERAVEAVGTAWTHTLGATDSSGAQVFGRNAADRNHVSEDSAPYVAAALDRIVGSSTLDGLAGMDKRSPQQMRDALIANLTAPGPNGVSREVAETMVRGMSDATVTGLRDSLVSGARDTRAAMTSAGLPEPMVRELGQVQVSQVQNLARAAGEINDPAAMLARDPNNFNVPREVRGMLEERNHCLAIEQGARNSTNTTYLPNGESISTMDQNTFGASRYTREQYDRLTYSSAAHVAQGSGLFDIVDPVGYQTNRTVSEDLSAGTSDMSAAARYSRNFASYDAGRADEVSHQEQAARDSVLTSINGGNFDQARSVADAQVRHYTSLGDQQSVQAWTNIQSEVNSLAEGAAAARQEGRPPPWESSPQAAAMGPGAVAATIASAPPADEVGRRTATIEDLGGRETRSRLDIADAVNSGNYTQAEALISDRIRHYREVGDERSALVYELAQTQVSGLRRNEYFDPDWAKGHPGDMPTALQHARDQVLSDIGVTRIPGATAGQADTFIPGGGLGGDSMRMTGRSIGQSYDFLRRGEETIVDATTRMDGELSSRGRADEGVRGMRQGPRPPSD